MSLSFVIGQGKEAPDALKKVNKAIKKIHTDFNKETKNYNDKDLPPKEAERDLKLIEQYDEKFKILLNKYNDWVQLFRKPIKRSKSTIWTGV